MPGYNYGPTGGSYIYFETGWYGGKNIGEVYKKNDGQKAFSLMGSDFTNLTSEIQKIYRNISLGVDTDGSPTTETGNNEMNTKRKDNITIYYDNNKQYNT